VSLSSAATPEELDRAFRDTAAVIHLAGRAHVMKEAAADSLAAYREANVTLARRAVEAAARAGCRTFVLASSVKAVGDHSTEPWTEATPPQPTDPYGQSKLEAEHAVTEAGLGLGLRTVILRLPLIYGPGMRANMLRLFQAVDRGFPLPLGRIANRRSLLFVGNAAAAMECAILSQGSGCYFVSDGRDLSTPELVRAVATALGRPARLLPVPATLFRAAGMAGDALARFLPCPVTSKVVDRLLGSLQVDITRARREIGYTPAYTIEAGMRETAAWFRTGRSASSDPESTA